MKYLRQFYFVLSVLIISLIAGCVSYEPPPAVIHSDNYTAISFNEQRAVPPTDKVLTKETAIAIALQNNPDYVTAQLNMIAAYATYYAALAAFSPSVSVGYNANQIQSNAGGAGEGFNESATMSTTWSNPSYAGSGYTGTTQGTAITYQVFSGLQTTMQMLSTRALAKQKEWMVKNYRRTLVQDVIVNYNQILMDRAKLRIQQANELFQKEMANITLLKYNAGASSLSELLNFKILANNARADAIDQEKLYKIDRYILAALMGLTTADLPIETRFPEISVGAADEFELGVEFYLDIAINERPDLKAQKEALASARYNLYTAWGAFSPTLNLNMAYGFNAGAGSTTGSDVWFGQNTNFNYGLSANWNLWQGGARIFQVRQQEALFDIEKQNLLNTWITIVKEVRSEYVDLLANAARRKIYDETKEMSRQRRDLLQEEYNAGNVSIATLNQGQQELVTAQQNYITSTIDVSNSRAKLYAAVGFEQ